jgi:UDP-glucuronate 4-epimerase
MQRDFTYVDDIVEGVARILEKPVADREQYEIYNIGNNNAVQLSDFIEAIEQHVGKKAEKEMLPMQPGDVERTWANVDDLIADYEYRPDTSVEDGVKRFVEWYKGYYKVRH